MSEEFQEAVDNFFLAAEYGRADVIKALADHCRDRLALADIVDPVTGRSPLHVAVAGGKKDALRVLLAAGFPPDHQSNRLKENEQGNRSAYALAQELKAQDLLLVFHQFLIQQVAANDVQSVNQLLAAGVDVNITDETTGGSLIHWAASCQAAEVLENLLVRDDVQRLKLVDARNGEGATPLHIACHENDVKCVQLLLTHDADGSLRGNKGFSEGKTARELATKPEVKRLFSQIQNEVDVIDKREKVQIEEGIHTKKNDGETLCLSTTAKIGELETCVHKIQNEKLWLQLEEKDLLVNQLKRSLETLVQESQESAMLGEERVMLEYVRKLRDEKMIVERKLEDATDYIRDQQLQLDSLKEQIRQMSAGGKQLEADQDVSSHTTEGSTTSIAAGPPDSAKSNRSASEMQQLQRQIDEEGTSSRKSIAQPLMLDTWTSKAQREQEAFTRYVEKHGPDIWSTVWNGIWAGTAEAAQDEDEEVVITV